MPISREQTRLLQFLSRETEAELPWNATTAFFITLSRLLSLSVLRTGVFRSLIAYKAFYYLDLAQNFSYLALLATQVATVHSKTGSYGRWDLRTQDEGGGTTSPQTWHVLAEC